MSVRWYNKLKDLAAAFGCPDDEGRTRFIDFGTTMAAWFIFACLTYLIIICAFQMGIFYVSFGYIALFLLTSLLFTLEDWRFYLATEKGLKQRVKDWFLFSINSFREFIIKSRRKVFQGPHVTNGRGRTPSPTQPPKPPASQVSGIEDMRKQLGNVIPSNQSQSDRSSPAVTQTVTDGTESTQPLRPRTRSRTRELLLFSEGLGPESMSTTQQQQPAQPIRRSVRLMRGRSSGNNTGR